MISPSPDTTRRPGRPSVVTRDIIEAIVSDVRKFGIGLKPAAEKQGISFTSLHRHLQKEENEEDQIAIDQARAQWLCSRIKELQEGLGEDADGNTRPHPHASQISWLIGKHFKFYGDKTTIEHEGSVTHNHIFTPEVLKDLRDRRQAALSKTEA